MESTRRNLLKWLVAAPVVGPVVVQALGASPIEADVPAGMQSWPGTQFVGYDIGDVVMGADGHIYLCTGESNRGDGPLSDGWVEVYGVPAMEDRTIFID